MWFRKYNEFWIDGGCGIGVVSVILLSVIIVVGECIVCLFVVCRLLVLCLIRFSNDMFGGIV